MILAGPLAAVKAVVDTISTNVSTLLTRLNPARAGYLDNLQYYTQTKAGYLDQAISTVGVKSVQVFDSFIDASVSRTNTHTVTQVDLTKTFPIVTSYMNTRTTDPQSWGLKCEFTSDTVLEVQAGTGFSGTTQYDIYYTVYVVEFN